ncbi:hypothetical protein BGZ83_005172 [Gryganskiella cystojenkinii]|nr:hypothetical protein BGZ83_005172 [Gryganskiella cystojenkinii]
MHRHFQSLIRTRLVRAPASSRQCLHHNNNNIQSRTRALLLSRIQHPPSSHSNAFSTSTAAPYAIRTMTLDDLDLDLESPSSSKPQPAASRSPATATATADKEEQEQEGNIRFFGPDHPHNVPERIKSYREQYYALRAALASSPTNITSNTLIKEKERQLLATYRALADDPVWLAQLQPIDFMFILNILRDQYQVIPKMQEILRDVRKSQHSKVPEIYHIVLKAYFKLSDFKSSSNLLESMKQDGIEFNTATYHIMLDICKHESKAEKARKLLHEMRAKKIEITTATYLLMITICGRTKRPKGAREYFDEMPRLGIERDITHYNALMSAYAHAKDYDAAKSLFELMLNSKGLEPNQYTYSAMVKACLSNKRIHDAEKVVKFMEEETGQPANVQVLTALGINSPLDIMQKCVEAEANGRLKMTPHDFNVLLIKSIRTNHFTQTPLIMEEMAKHGFRPDLYTFQVMIDANIKMRNYPEAKSIFNAMKQSNIQPDVVAYSTLIAGALAQAGVPESIDILKIMVMEDGLLPNQYTFNSLLSASVGEVDVKAIKLIRNTMDAIGIRPDNRSFNALLSAYALEGDLDEMMATFDEMKASRVMPDKLTYSILISGFLQNGDLRYSMEWYYRMIEQGFTPAVFLVNNLMAALYGSGQGQQVILLAKEMERMSLRKNEQSFEILFETCEKYGLSDARSKLEEEYNDYLTWVNGLNEKK